MKSKAGWWVAVAALGGSMTFSTYEAFKIHRLESAATAVVQAWDNTTPSCANGAEMAVLEEAVVKLDAAVSR